MGCIAWTGLDGNLWLSDSVTLHRKSLKVAAAEDGKLATRTTLSLLINASVLCQCTNPPALFSLMAVERSQSNRSHGSRSSSSWHTDRDSSSLPRGSRQDSSPLLRGSRRDSSPLPRGPFSSSSPDPEGPEPSTQEVFGAVRENMHQNAAYRRRGGGEDLDLDRRDAVFRPSKRRCDVPLDVQ